ncbi:MAG: dienelactone hydrolase, partial [Pseudomonadota bacterium]
MTLCGYTRGLIRDPHRLDWDGQAERPIAWTAWFPTNTKTHAPQPGFFDLGAVELDAPIQPGRYPVVLLSHGTGGTAESLGWLAGAIAREGYVVIGANHHGNTGLEPYRAEGFLCWWERTRDLSTLLTLLSEGPFKDALDLSSVTAIGFSLGGPTVLAALGARYEMARFDAWRESQPNMPLGPVEFPDLGDHVANLFQTSQPFQASWATHGEDLTDPRIKKAIAIAAAPPVRAFTLESVRAIDRPVTLITGEADREAPTDQCSAWLTALNPSFRHVSMGQ